MTDNASNFSVNRFLCNCGALLRIACVVFSLQFELNFLATDADAFGVGFFDGQTRCVFVVFAQVSDLTDVGPT